MIDKKEKSSSLPSTLSSFHIEADRTAKGMKMFVSGIIGIGDYTEESLLLKSHGGRVEILGKRLKICVFESKTVEISGKITGVSFVYGKG